MQFTPSAKKKVSLASTKGWEQHYWYLLITFFIAGLGTFYLDDFDSLSSFVVSGRWTQYSYKLLSL